MPPSRRSLLALAAIVAVASLAGCALPFSAGDPIWRTCGNFASWTQPGLYDALPSAYAREGVRHREVPSSSLATLPFKTPEPLALYLVVWGSDVSLFLQPKQGGGVLLSAPVDNPTPVAEGRDQVDAFLENVTAGSAQERAAWTDTLVRSAPRPVIPPGFSGGNAHWVQIPAVRLDDLPARLDQIAPRSTRTDPQVVWTWAVPAPQEGRIATIEMRLLDTRPLRQIAWTDPDAFVLSVDARGHASLASRDAQPDELAQARLVATFHDLGLPPPSFGGWSNERRSCPD